MLLDCLEVLQKGSFSGIIDDLYFISSNKQKQKHTKKKNSLQRTAMHYRSLFCAESHQRMSGPSQQPRQRPYWSARCPCAIAVGTVQSHGSVAGDCWQGKSVGKRNCTKCTYVTHEFKFTNSCFPRNTRCLKHWWACSSAPSLHRASCCCVRLSRSCAVCLHSLRLHSGRLVSPSRSSEFVCVCVCVCVYVYLCVCVCICVCVWWSNKVFEWYSECLIRFFLSGNIIKAKMGGEKNLLFLIYYFNVEFYPVQ